jgi:DNA polymerase V
MFALVDVNNMYVSCERVFRPALNGKPVVVLSNNDGACIARSNEAKDLGVKMAQPWFEVKHLERSAGLIALSANFELYGDMSSRMMAAGRPLRATAGDLQHRRVLPGLRRRIRGPCRHRSRAATPGAPMGGTAHQRRFRSDQTLAKLANHVAKTADRKPGTIRSVWRRSAISERWDRKSWTT